MIFNKVFLVFFFFYYNLHSTQQVYVFNSFNMKSTTINTGILTSLNNILFQGDSLKVSDKCYLNYNNFFNNTYESNAIYIDFSNFFITGIGEYQIGSYALALDKNNRIGVVILSSDKLSDDPVSTFNDVYADYINGINNSDIMINNIGTDNLYIGDDSNKNIYFRSDNFVNYGTITTDSNQLLLQFLTQANGLSNLPMNCGANLIVNNGQIKADSINIKNSDAIITNLFSTHNINITGATTITVNNNTQNIIFLFFNHIFDLNQQSFTFSGIQSILTPDQVYFYFGTLDDGTICYSNIDNANIIDAIGDRAVFSAKRNIYFNGTIQESGLSYNFNADFFEFRDSNIEINNAFTFNFGNVILSNQTQNINQIVFDNLILAEVSNIGNILAFEKGSNLSINEKINNGIIIFNSFPLVLNKPSIISTEDLNTVTQLVVDTNGLIGISNQSNKNKRYFYRENIFKKEEKNIANAISTIQKKLIKIKTIKEEIQKIKAYIIRYGGDTEIRTPDL